MAFNYINDEQKIQISLSTNAEKVISDDMLRFGETKTTTFLNKIITNFKEDAKASISISVNSYKDELENMLAKNNIDKTLHETIIKNMALCYINKQLSNKKKYDNSKRIILRINNENMNYLLGEVSSSTECNEDKYYAGAPQYIRALIEEYCELNYLIREKIILKPYFDEITNALMNKCLLKVKTQNNKIIHVTPYSIECDNQNIYHYLLCVNHDIDTSKYNDLQAYRISNLKAVTCLKTKSKLKTEKISEIKKIISQKGCQFVSSDIVKAKVKLSNLGVKQYNSQFHLRPKYTAKNDDDNIYEFECTSEQLLFYFFKFGSDAVILEPQNLVNKFCKKYQLALSQYNE